MKRYYVDAENVQNAWLGLVNEEESRFKVFYTNSGISYDYLPIVLNNYTRIEFVKCYGGYANALDFQLISSFGYDLKDSDINDEYIVISNDKGYDKALQFWKDRGYNVSRIIRSQIDPPKKEEVFNYSEDEIALKLVSYLGNDKRQECYLVLMAIYGNEKGIAIYNRIKKDIPEAFDNDGEEGLELFVKLLAQNNPDVLLGEREEDFTKMLIDNKPGKLPVYKSCLIEKYGKDKGTQIYALTSKMVKPAFKFYLKGK